MEKLLILRAMAKGMHGVANRVVADFAERGRIGLEDLAEEISHSCTLTKADIVGCITALTETIARHLGCGESVVLGELGTLSATVRAEVTPTTPTEPTDNTTSTTTPPKGKSPTLRVADATLGRVCFRASPLLKQLVAARMQQCVVRSKRLAPAPPPPTTQAKRLALVQHYLQTHRAISVRQYAQLATISHSRAASELRTWRADPTTHIGTAYFGTRAVAVWGG